MTQVTYSFEGGTSGNTVAAGAGAGTGDTNFDAVTNAGATDTYDNAHAAHGTLANKIATTTSATSFNAWTTSIGTQTTVWVRAYLFFTAAPSVQHRVINFVGATASRGNVLATTSGTLIFTNAAGGTVLTSAAFPTGAWFRLEAKFTGSTTVGQWEYKIWNSPDSAGTPSDTQTSAANLNTGGTCDTYRFGIGTAVASAGPFWLDDIGVSTTAYLGPAVSTQVATATLTGAGVVADTPVTEIVPAAAAGAGAVTAAITQAAPAALTGAATVTAKATQAAPAALAGAGTVTDVVTQAVIASLTGAGSVTANASVIGSGNTAALAGASAVTANAVQIATAALAVRGTLTPLATQRATAQMAAAATVTAAGSQAGAFTVGALTAVTAAASALTTAQASSALTASAASSALTATDIRTGGPGG